MRIGLIPLDDRPCNTRFPARLAEVAGVDLLMPPQPLLGRFLEPGQPDAIAEWLGDVAASLDGLALCVDMAVHGGLVASRRAPRSPDLTAGRLRTLERILPLVPGPVVLGSVIMRQTITVASDDDLRDYELVARYSELAGRLEDGEDVRGELASVGAAISAGVLDGFLAARARNHLVNLRCLEWLAYGLACAAVLTREDCRPHGLHRREQHVLAEDVERLGLGSRTWLHPGADELGCVTLARVILSLLGARPALAVRVLPEEGKGRTAPFEDRPVIETIVGQVDAVGACVGGREQSYAPVLLVTAPLPGGVDLTGDDYGGECADAAADAVADEASEMIERCRRRVVVADTCVANGAWLPLVRHLRDTGALDVAALYCAWNTAGNTLGTAIAFAAVAAAVGAFRSRALRRFRAERLVDDVAYQSIVRERLCSWLRDRGIPTHRIPDEHAAEVGEWLSRELIPTAEEEGLAEPGRSWRVGLPWGRTFECDVELLA